MEAYAGGGPLGIDHEWNYDDHGIWSRSVQDAVLYSLVAGELVGAIWEGGDTRFGHTVAIDRFLGRCRSDIRDIKEIVFARQAD